MPDNQMSVQQSPQMNLNGWTMNDIAGNFIQIQGDVIQRDALKKLAEEDHAKLGKVKDATNGHPAAGQWLLQREEYISWKAGVSESRLLWLKGTPGAGKTVLSSVAIKDVKKAAGCHVIYGFCDQKDNKKRDPTNLLGSLLGQLLQSAPPSPEAENEIRRQCEQGVLFCGHDLKDIIKDQSPKSEKTFAVIDGLDECDNLPQLLPLLKDLATKLYVFVSSRDHRHIREHFQDQTQLAMGVADTAHDVQQFVKAKLEAIGKRVRLKPHIVDSYFHRLTSGARGTFLWPASHIEQLQDLISRAEIDKSLNDLPPGVCDMMERALKWIHKFEHRPERTVLVLKLALCATRPLTLPELAEGVAVDEMRDVWELSSVADNPMLLVDGCANLLVCVPHPREDLSQIVVPFHKLVEKYLLPNSDKPTRSKTFHRPAVHVQIARLCLKYLKLRATGRVRSILSKVHRHPFAAYAVAGWLEHIRASGTGELAKEFQEFLSPWSSTFEEWRRLFAKWSGPFTSQKVLDHLEHQVQPAHLAVWFDLPKLIPCFSRDQLCAEDYRGLSALHIAMEIPNPISVIKPLLEIVDVNQVSRDGNTALHVVVSQFGADEEAVIQWLCENGAKIDKPDKEGRTALHLAMLNPGAAQRCILPLLERHASPRARDLSRQTPLHIAAAAPRYVMSRASESPECQGKTVEAYCRAMGALLARQPDTQSTDRKGNTPLHLAADNVNPFAVEALLKRKAFVDVVNNEGCTPLHLAIKCNLPGCRRNVSTIPEQRYQQFTMVPGGQFTTPEQRDQHLTVEYLIRNAASINTPVNDELKRSPLHLAALSCCNEIVFNLLVENNAGVNATDARGNTAMHLAAIMAPIKNPDDPANQWRISWTSLRQIMSKLITDESDLHALHQTSEKIIHFIGSRYAGAIAAGAFQDDEDDLDHPFTAWFEHVKKLLCSKGASIGWTNDECQNVLACTTAFWSSWIQSDYREMAATQTTVCELYTEWVKISKL